MADVYMKSKFYFKRGKAASWTAQNIVLGPGEPGFEIDTGKLKIGNGSTPWNELEYVTEAVDTIRFLGSQTSLPEVATDGEICEIDDVFYIRSNGEWKKLTGAAAPGAVEVIKIRGNEISPLVEINGTKYNSIDEALNAVSEGDLITLPSNFNDSINIPTGKRFGLQLQGAKLISDSKSPLTIAHGSTITISGNGLLECNKNGAPALLNNGEVYINGISIKRSTDIKNNGYYTIVNHGQMTIEDGIVNHNGEISSMIENGYYNYSSSSSADGYVASVNDPAPKLTINGGSFASESYVVKNDDSGTVEINDGNFYGSLYNTGLEMTINGGTFDSVGFYNLRTRHYDDPLNVGLLRITGGTFTSTETDINILAESGAQVIVTGGSFNHEVPAEYIPEGYKQTFEGDYYIITKEG